MMVEGNSSDHYITHTTAPKENFYSIGRIYNISPRVYAPYNGLSVDAPGGLGIGQELKIPLNELNFSQDGKAEPGEVFVPLYYRTTSRMPLSAISTLFKTVPVENLQAWNRLSGENVFAGSTIIVGYLKVKSDLSPLAKFAVTVPKSDVASAKPDEKPVEQPKPAFATRAAHRAARPSAAPARSRRAMPGRPSRQAGRGSRARAPGRRATDAGRRRVRAR